MNRFSEHTRRRHVFPLLLMSLLSTEPLLAQDKPTADSAAVNVKEWMQAATAHMAADEWQEAAAAWSEVIKADPDHVVAYLNRALSHFRLGECSAREADARAVLSLLADETLHPPLETSVYRAQAHSHLLEFDQTVQLLEAALEGEPENRSVEILLNLTKRRQRGESEWVCSETVARESP